MKPTCKSQIWKINQRTIEKVCRFFTTFPSNETHSSNTTVLRPIVADRNNFHSPPYEGGVWSFRTERMWKAKVWFVWATPVPRTSSLIVERTNHFTNKLALCVYERRYVVYTNGLVWCVIPYLSYTSLVTYRYALTETESFHAHIMPSPTTYSVGLILWA